MMVEVRMILLHHLPGGNEEKQKDLLVYLAINQKIKP
jgi:hypothetical protein